MVTERLLQLWLPTTNTGFTVQPPRAAGQIALPAAVWDATPHNYPHNGDAP